MQLRHATLKSNIDSIQRDGLLPAKSRGKRQSVWIHSSSRTPWAILHMQTRWNAPIDETVILTVDVPRSWLTRHQAGLWYCFKIIPPERIISVEAGTKWAESPVKDNC